MEYEWREFEVYDTGQAETGEIIMRMVDKKSRQMWWLVNPVIDENGRLVSVDRVETESTITVPLYKEV